MAVARGRLGSRLRGRPTSPSAIGAEGAGANRWAWRLAASVLGVPLALAFPRPALWWLGFIALAPLILLVRAAPSAREAGIRAWLGGSLFFLSVDSWLLPEAKILAIPAALLLGALWLPWGRLAWRLLGTRTAPWDVQAPLEGRRVAAAMVLLPSVFVLGEVVRSWDALGGPWALLGASQWNDLPILALASLGGVWLVSLVLMAVNVGVAVAAGPRVPATVRAGAALATCALLLGSLAWSAVRPAPASGGGTLRVGLVQPGKIDPVGPRFAASESASLGLAGSHPNLIVWSESSVGRDPVTNPGDIAALRRVVQATGADVLANVDARRRTGGIYKSSLLVGPNGPIASYDKIRLVPFGEYIPSRPLLGWVARFTQAAAQNRHHGSRLVLMRSGSVVFGPLICFERSSTARSRPSARSSRAARSCRPRSPAPRWRSTRRAASSPGSRPPGAGRSWSRCPSPTTTPSSTASATGCRWPASSPWSWPARPRCAAAGRSSRPPGLRGCGGRGRPRSGGAPGRRWPTGRTRR